MPHRLELGELAGVLALADRRVVGRDLLDRPAAQLVEPRVADVADHRAVAVDHRDREHAGHAVPLGRERGLAVDLVVGEGDGVADAIRVGRRCRSQPRAHDVERRIGRPPAGGLSADAVDDDEDAALGIDVRTDPR